MIAVPARSALAVARECAAKRVQRADGDIRRLRRDRGGGRRASARAGRGLPRRRNATGRAQLPRRHQHGRGLAAQRNLRPRAPPPGNVGFVTQSGALGLALIDLAADRGLGVSSFASIGNRADITANDFLEYWEGDRATGVALLYIESFSDPRRFSRLARRIGREMPIAAVKSGRSVSGERAHQLAHRGAALGIRCYRRRALRAGGRDPHRDARGASRRCLPARQPAAPAGASGRDSDQRGRAGHHVRGRLRGGRPAGARAAGAQSGTRCASSWHQRPDWPTRWT